MSVCCASIKPHYILKLFVDSDDTKLSDWYKDNFNKLDSLYENDPDNYWWIDTNLPEVSNTGEAISKLSDSFEIV